MIIKQNPMGPKLDTISILQNRVTNVIKNDVTLSPKDFTQIDTLLKELFSNLKNGVNLKSQILNLLKQLPVFKNFEGLNKEIETLVNKLDIKTASKEIEVLKNSLVNMNKLDGNTIKNNFLKSGIFLENYIKNFMEQHNSKEEFISNIKTTLLQLSEHSNDDIKNQSNKIISQLEYFSLYSITNNTNKIPLSFDWSDLKEGDIEFFEATNELHTCQINLDLESLGNLKINLSYDKNNATNIAFLCEKEETKGTIQNNLQKLKKEFVNKKLHLQSVGVHDLNINHDIENKFTQTIDPSYKIDIKA